MGLKDRAQFVADGLRAAFVARSPLPWPWPVESLAVDAINDSNGSVAITIKFVPDVKIGNVTAGQQSKAVAIFYADTWARWLRLPKVNGDHDWNRFTTEIMEHLLRIVQREARREGYTDLENTIARMRQSEEARGRRS